MAHPPRYHAPVSCHHNTHYQKWLMIELWVAVVRADGVYWVPARKSGGLVCWKSVRDVVGGNGTETLPDICVYGKGGQMIGEKMKV